MSPRPPVDLSRAKRFLVFAGVVVALAALFSTIFHSLLLPLAVSAFFTYLLLPLVGILQKKARLPRFLAVAVIILSSLAVIVLAVLLLAPRVYDQAAVLVRLVPVAFNTVMQTWIPSLEKTLVDLGIVTSAEFHQTISIPSLLNRLQYQIQAGISGIWATGASVFGGVFNLIAIPILTFFMLYEYVWIAASLRRLVPRDLLASADSLMHKVNVALRSVLKGQVTVASILAVLYVAGLSFVGLQSAIAIGLIAGACRIIPYLDVIVGGVLSALVIVTDFQGVGHAVSVALVFLIVQAIDGAVITPRIIGERIGLHPVLVVLSVIAFADWFGFWGVLLAIPTVAIVKVLWTVARPYYLASRAYLGKGSAPGRPDDVAGLAVLVEDQDRVAPS